MHIALVTHHYPPEVGAPQRRWAALVPRFIQAGHRVTVLTPPPHYPTGTAGRLPEHLRPGRVTTGEHGERVLRVRFHTHGPGLLSRTSDQCVAAADSVARGIRDMWPTTRRPDVVVATVPGIPSIGAGVALRRALRAPLVVEMRDAWPDLIEPSGMMGAVTARQGWRGLVTAQIHRAMTLLQRDAAAIVTTTDAFADVLRDRGMRWVEVVRNGVYLEEVPHLRPAADRRPLRVLYLGTVGRSQGLDTAVRAAALLQRRGEAVELRIVGPGADYPRLGELVRRSGAAVELRGAVPRAEVYEHYRWADSLLISLRSWVPLRWTVPSKLYEAMATGRHVCGVVEGEAAEIVRSTGAGDVVTPEDPQALADLWAALSADRSRLAVGETARSWAFEHSDYDRLAEHYLDVLAEVQR